MFFDTNDISNAGRKNQLRLMRASYAYWNRSDVDRNAPLPARS